MLRLVAASIGATLMFAMPVGAEKLISLKDLREVGEVTIYGTAGKQLTRVGFLPVRVASNGGWEVEPIYAPHQAENGSRRGNIIGVTADGRPIFCFCGGSSF